MRYHSTAFAGEIGSRLDVKDIPGFAGNWIFPLGVKMAGWILTDAGEFIPQNAPMYSNN